jgi:cell wall assembly regulator SMI1
VDFQTIEPPISAEEIAQVESDLGLVLPADLKGLYLASNGGTPPYPCRFGRGESATLIAEFLPLESEKGMETASDVYEDMVRDRELLPTTMFPFARDAGGDYFFTDCATRQGEVYVYRHDSIGEPLGKLDCGVSEFWASMQIEK